MKSSCSDPLLRGAIIDDGNRTRRTDNATGETHDYTWDHRNRLTKVVIKNSGGAIIREAPFTYDVNNNNIIIRWTDPDGAGPLAADQFFTVYDGIHAYADFDSAGVLTQRYLYGDQPDQLLAIIKPNGDVSYPLLDNVNSVRQYVNALGVVLNEIDVDSFGNIVDESNPSAAPRQNFTARELERSIGLLWHRARWYDPLVGRFISEDPIALAGDVNLARYTENNPISRIDPTGLSWAPPDWPKVDGEPFPPDWYNNRWTVEEFLRIYLQLDENGRHAIKRGCVGLCAIRVGTPLRNPLIAKDIRCFKSATEAFQVYEDLRGRGQNPVIIVATHTSDPVSDNINLPGPPLRDFDPESTEVDPRSFPIKDAGQYNFSTYIGKGCYEHINDGYTSQKDGGYNVIHGGLAGPPRGRTWKTEYYCVVPNVKAPRPRK